MVSSYEYECHYADRSLGGTSGLNRTASSFDSLVSGGRFHKGKHQPSRTGGKYPEATSGSHENMGKSGGNHSQTTQNQLVGHVRKFGLFCLSKESIERH